MDDNNSEPNSSTEPIPPVAPASESKPTTPKHLEPLPTSDSSSSKLDEAQPGSEPEPEPSISSSAPTSDPFRAQSQPPSSHLRAFVIVGVLIILLAVGGFAIFKYRDTISSLLPGSSDSDAEVRTEIVYSTPEGSTDPVGDYVAFMEKKISAAATPLEKLSATLDLAEYLMRQDQISRAIAILDALSPSDYTTDREKYTYYSAYAEIYSVDFLDKPDLAAEYSALAAEYDPNRPIDYPEDE